MYILSYTKSALTTYFHSMDGKIKRCTPDIELALTFETKAEAKRVRKLHAPNFLVNKYSVCKAIVKNPVMFSTPIWVYIEDPDNSANNLIRYDSLDINDQKRIQDKFGDQIRELQNLKKGQI